MTATKFAWAILVGGGISLGIAKIQRFASTRPICRRVLVGWAFALAIDAPCTA